MKKIGLRIHTWPEKILRKKCKKVDLVDEQIRELLDEMCLVMLNDKGIGLAANQVGLDISMVVVALEDKLFKLVNPCIVKKEGTMSILEGCLSFPGLELEVKRSKKVWVSALNEKGEPLDIEADGVLAIIFQHEIDHVNGITFISRVPFRQRLKVSAQLKEIKKMTKNGLSKQSKKQ